MTAKSIHSQDLGIRLDSLRELDLFGWFLACLLFGKPIQQDVAARTYREFVRERLTSPDAILNAGWDRLVEVLDHGHYVRYDFSTATKLLDVCETLEAEYGSVTGLIRAASSRADLKRRLEAFKGVGPVTARIFLRDLNQELVRQIRRRGSRQRHKPAAASR